MPSSLDVRWWSQVLLRLALATVLSAATVLGLAAAADHAALSAAEPTEYSAPLLLNANSSAPTSGSTSSSD